MLSKTFIAAPVLSEDLFFPRLRITKQSYYFWFEFQKCSVGWNDLKVAPSVNHWFTLSNRMFHLYALFVVLPMLLCLYSSHVKVSQGNWEMRGHGHNPKQILRNCLVFRRVETKTKSLLWAHIQRGRSRSGWDWKKLTMAKRVRAISELSSTHKTAVDTTLLIGSYQNYLNISLWIFHCIILYVHVPGINHYLFLFLCFSLCLFPWLSLAVSLTCTHACTHTGTHTHGYTQTGLNTTLKCNAI